MVFEVKTEVQVQYRGQYTVYDGSVYGVLSRYPGYSKVWKMADKRGDEINTEKWKPQRKILAESETHQSRRQQNRKSLGWHVVARDNHHDREEQSQWKILKKSL